MRYGRYFWTCTTWQRLVFTACWAIVQVLCQVQRAVVQVLCQVQRSAIAGSYRSLLQVLRVDAGLYAAWESLLLRFTALAAPPPDGPLLPNTPPPPYNPPTPLRKLALPRGRASRLRLGLRGAFGRLGGARTRRYGPSPWGSGRTIRREG